MKYENCKYGDKCKYYHPKKLKNESQNTKSTSGQMYTGDVLPYSYVDVVKKSLQPQLQVQSPFLGQAPQIKQPVIEPPLEKRNIAQQTYLEIQQGQKQILELVMNLNQKVINLEKNNII